MMLISPRQTLLAGAFALISTAAPATTHTYTYKLIAVAKALQTNPVGINASGTILGYWVDAAYNNHGFTYDHGKLTSFNVPKAKSTRPTGFNDKGEIVGQFTDASDVTHGFFYTASAGFTTVTPKGSTNTGLNAINAGGTAVGETVDSTGAVTVFTYKDGVYKTITTGDSAIAVAINAQGTIAGYFAPPHGYETAFVYEAGKLTTLPIKNVYFAQSFDVNASNVVVGQVANTKHQEFGFEYKDGKVRVFGFPKSTDSFFTGINNLGAIAGATFPTSGAAEGFVYDKGDFSTLTVKGMKGVGAFAINDAGQVLGDYSDNNVAKLFLATPSK